MNPFSVLEDQVRECFGRVIYTHKTHEKMADVFTAKLKRYKVAQIGFAALTTSGLLASFALEPWWLKPATALVSLCSIFVTTFLKDLDLGADAQKHRDAASKIWGVRESYLSLLTDLRMSSITDDQGREKRDRLQYELGQIYVGAPQTNYKAYEKAQKALKEKEDYTFSKEEINKFLPDTLKKP